MLSKNTAQHEPATRRYFLGCLALCLFQLYAYTAYTLAGRVPSVVEEGVVPRPPPQLRSRLRALWRDLSHHGSDRSDHERQRVLERATSGGAPVSPDDVTLTTHGTVSKLGQLLTQIAWWHGPVSAAIYIAGPTDIGAFVDFVDAHRGPLRATTFHVLMEKTKLLYPHNALRNLALEHAESDYFLALDGDFVPPPEAHAGLAGLIRGHAGLREGLRARTLFVLPAFEAVGAPPHRAADAAESLLPRSKRDVLRKVRDGSLVEFHAQFKRGHGATRYQTWLKDSTDVFYTIDYEERFEPYVLGYRHGVPKLWTRFRGFGYNKASWFVQLDRAGYKFAVLRDYFVTHLPHRSTQSRASRKGNEVHWKSLKEDLAKVYGEPSVALPTRKDRAQNTATANVTLPTVLLAGVQKGGTSALSKWLGDTDGQGACQSRGFAGADPDPTRTTSTKEVHFFNQGARFAAGRALYEACFRHCVDDQARRRKRGLVDREGVPLILDATPSYFYHPDRVHRVYEAAGQLASLKIIFSLREPIARDLSRYNHQQHLRKFWHDANVTSMTYDEYVREFTLPGIERQFSLYPNELSKWLKLFSHDQILILSYEELLDRPDAVKERMAQFLNFSPKEIEMSHSNTKASPEKVKRMKCATQALLQSKFEPYNERLYALLESKQGPPMEQRPFPKFRLSECTP